MQDKKSLKYLFVVNPGSGRNTGDSWTEIINDFFKESELVFEIYVLPGKFDVQEVKTNIFDRAPQQVIAVGGDGTVTMLANILAGKEIPLGILPGGSANGMAKELGIPEKATEALEIIKAGIVMDCDLIKINDKDHCLHLSDLGLNAQLIRYFDQGKLRGKLGYGRVVFKTLLNKQKMNVLIRTNDTEIRRTAFMVALANARTYGTGAVINPEGKTNDGLFEVIIVKKLRFGALLKMLFKPGLFNPKNIEIIPCTSVEITTGRRMHFQIDGEYAGREKNVTAIIQPGAVKMILPAS
ncbi:MAG: diacylglycerol kinase family lipid kinase [Ferruginibacter sp.]|nr:diacylglycerol kinase family lipid kinase [Chitinophagaceae bacterium]